MSFGLIRYFDHCFVSALLNIWNLKVILFVSSYVHTMECIQLCIALSNMESLHYGVNSSNYQFHCINVNTCTLVISSFDIWFTHVGLPFDGGNNNYNSWNIFYGVINLLVHISAQMSL